MILVEDWLSTLESPEPCTDAMTVLGWKAKTGRSKEATAKWIRQGLDNGWMETAPTTVVSLSGISRTIIGFRLTGRQ